MPSTPHIVSAVALVAAIAAGALALRQGPAPALPGAPDAELARTVRELQDEVRALRNAPMPAAGNTLPATERTPANTFDPARIDALEQRLARLEQNAHVSGPLSSPTENGPRAALPTPQDAAAKQQAEAAAVAKLQQTFVDARLSEAERLAALGDLRTHRATARVVDAAIRLAQTSTVAATRADVWRQLSHANAPSLVQPLLLSMQTDADAKVREEAAETLGDYLDQPGVQQALRTASESDADPAVRRQALRSLGGGRRG